MGTLQTTIPAYLYWQYNEDEDLIAIFQAFNDLNQEYLDWFNQLSLPIYTQDPVAGTLLDWVGAGLYGIDRRLLSTGSEKLAGPYNTWRFNTLAFNAEHLVGSSIYFATTDDIYRRILTWHFYKADGWQFSVRWLKRRIMRFLLGTNGTAPNVNNTSQISVTFSGVNQIDIHIISGQRLVQGGALYNRFAFNTMVFNGLKTTFNQFPALSQVQTFKSAVQSGVLELPFQFDYVVTTS